MASLMKTGTFSAVAQRPAAASRRSVVARASDTPANVIEARQWISNWQNKDSAKAVANANPNRPSWFPGHPWPEHLDGSLPADFGFDPLSLGKDPEALKWYVQGELINGRTAMTAVAGILGPELATNIGIQWPGAGVAWFDAGAYPYFAPASSLFAVQMLLCGFVEARRYQDYVKPGSANVDPFGNKLPDNNSPGYPGGMFDPFGWSKGDLETLKVKELKNGRLAMVAFVGFVSQAATTGLTPLAALSKHLANPWETTVLSSDVHTKVFFPFLN